MVESRVHGCGGFTANDRHSSFTSRPRTCGYPLSTIHYQLVRGLLRQQREGQADEEGGYQGAEEELQGGDSSFAELALEDGLAGGVGGIGDDGEASADDGAGDDGIAERIREAGDEGGEIGDGGVVVEGSEDGGADHEGPAREAAEDGGDPPLLAAAVEDEGGEEKADEEGAAQLDG